MSHPKEAPRPRPGSCPIHRDPGALHPYTLLQVLFGGKNESFLAIDNHTYEMRCISEHRHGVFDTSANRSKLSLKSYLQPHTEDVFFVEFFGEKDCVLDMLVIEQQVYLLGDVISQSKLYSALIICALIFTVMAALTITFRSINNDWSWFQLP